MKAALYHARTRDLEHEAAAGQTQPLDRAAAGRHELDQGLRLRFQHRFHHPLQNPEGRRKTRRIVGILPGQELEPGGVQVRRRLDADREGPRFEQRLQGGQGGLRPPSRPVVLNAPEIQPRARAVTGLLHPRRRRRRPFPHPPGGHQNRAPSLIPIVGSVANLAKGRCVTRGASRSPHVSALARRSCSNAMASVRAHGPRPKARSTIRASPTMPPWRANIPAWPLRSARITSKPLIVA